MEKYLRCHTSGDYMTRGRLYKVISENDIEYGIIDNTEDEHYFTKQPDEEGYSYRTWFTVIGEEGEDE